MPTQTDKSLVYVTRDLKEQGILDLGTLDWDRIAARVSLKKLELSGFSDIAEKYYLRRSEVVINSYRY